MAKARVHLGASVALIAVSYVIGFFVGLILNLADAVIGVTFFVDNCWPLTAYTVHILIDGGSDNQEDYPKCSPLASDIHSFYPKLLRYRTAGVPIPVEKNKGGKR